MLRNWCIALCALSLSGLLFTSCDMMHDDTDDCPIGLYLEFKYDYNLQRDDMFNGHVGAVDVYVFDADGKYVTMQSEANTPLAKPLADPSYRMNLRLAPGKYKVVALAGQTSYAEQLANSRAHFVRSELRAGDDKTALDIRLDTRQAEQDGTAVLVVDNNSMPLDTLWHGMIMEDIDVSDVRPTYQTVSLVRDTKKINVTLREVDEPTTMDVENYDMKIIDHNDHLLWDNSVDETLPVVYTPHATWNTDDRTPATDTSGNPQEGVGKIAHADFMTSRIIYHENPAQDGILSITNKNTGVEIIRVNVPDLLSRLRNYEDTQRYAPQEFLDRGYDYQMDFFLKGDRLAYVNISISVLPWTIRVQFDELK